MRDLIRQGRSRAPQRFDDRSPHESISPFFALRREMDRCSRMHSAGVGPMSSFAGASSPHIEVVDRDKEVRVTAELPGLEDKDIELRVEDGVLTLRGEKRTEFTDEERNYSERSYGRFERAIALPAEIDEERAEASFRNGVLSVTLPKTERARSNARRIPISY
jgi:HSP20 family protein